MTNNQKESFIYLGTALVYPVYYEKFTGEVSYIIGNSSILYTCFDYELNDLGGVEHLRRLLNSLPKEKIDKIEKVVH